MIYDKIYTHLWIIYKKRIIDNYMKWNNEMIWI